MDVFSGLGWPGMSTWPQLLKAYFKPNNALFKFLHEEKNKLSDFYRFCSVVSRHLVSFSLTDD